MSIIVCLPSTAAERPDEAVVEAMAPFQHDYASSDELDIWDYARICGGADGHGFAVPPGHEGDPRLIHDRPRHDGTLEPSLPGMCAGGPRELLHFTASRTEAEEIAGQAWDLWHAPAAEHPPAESQTTVARRTGEMGTEYWSQPLIRAFDEALDTLHRTRRTHRVDGLLAGPGRCARAARPMVSWPHGSAMDQCGRSRRDALGRRRHACSSGAGRSAE
ncbi:hypothetical protein [Streptomyces violascens]|uniref:hypothetical protein n=1 Tax=Streptomyces violascens TaxID=67381 RepID=UPI0036788D73